MTPKEIVLEASACFDGTIPGIDRYLEYFAEEAVWEFSPSAESPSWLRIEGKEEARKLYRAVYATRAQGESATRSVVAEGNTVVVEASWTSTLTDAANGLPAGTRRRFDFVAIYGVADGLIDSFRQHTGVGVVLGNAG